MSLLAAIIAAINSVCDPGEKVKQIINTVINSVCDPGGKVKQIINTVSDEKYVNPK
jgi:hypothetical protein